ncbi:hypothetical protein JDV02_010536 [Purpureocillium takamizusanense]|uniref:Zn(2)-C6 fungal-type domain-containing protein n=1 Tax=Purpureocillium takamizusanense TaxID=2060973 RepID=A0A9Q8VGP8_9HYPO|nr:uncharacterized protein JDV02_010536 [Purpureocillium takamizusanense]UNI24816.1 hypothetical protein JDV02_010536 [Purpureocillium takamizusanense]
MDDLRQACDRCHDKKLRCPKMAGSASCSRCEKACVPCIFSPPTRPQRASAHPALFDWALLQDPELPSEREPACDSSLPCLSMALAPPTETTKLAGLVISLDRLWRFFSSEKLLDLKDQLHARVNLVGGDSDLRRALEELLSHGQALSGLYLDVVDLMALGRRGADTGTPDPPSSQAPHPSLDQTTLGLLFATHLRYLDVLDCLLVFARLCASMAPSLPADYDPDFDVPEIRVGSFVAPKSTAASIFISMLVDLQVLLLARSQKLQSSLPPATPDASREVPILHLQMEHLTERADNSLQEMRQLKEHLIRAGAIR